eukprot:1159878-Pelagomonas_calceolata.AAC.7
MTLECTLNGIVRKQSLTAQRIPNITVHKQSIGGITRIAALGPNSAACTPGDQMGRAVRVRPCTV